MPRLTSASYLTYLLLVALVVSLFFHFKFYKEERVIQWDISLYYSYLPSAFIYHDFKVDFDDPPWYGHEFYMNKDEEGHYFVKMTSGLAMLYAPFFLLAHAYASLSATYPADGFSLPYTFALLASAAFYTLLGLGLLRKILLRFFGEGATALALAVTYLGTNLLYYSLKEPMSHVYNFALIAAVIYLFLRFGDRRSMGLAAAIGFLSGLIVLVRPTNIIALIFILIPFIYREGKNLKAFISYLLVAAFCGTLVILPQLGYWHYMTGHWVVYSYTDEAFYFTDPEIWKGLFSYRKGWFIYSPALVFAWPGFLISFKKHPVWTIAAVLTLALALWVTFSWWCWWYGGGLGARPLIDYLPVMALGLAAFFDRILRWKKIVQWPVYLLVAFLCSCSAFFAYQYNFGIIHHDSMSKELFWKQFFVPHYIQDYSNYLDPPDYEAARSPDGH